jgi:predicted ATPase
MPAGLLERRDDLRVLRAALDRARSGNGGAALVAGEAGIGKTSLVRRFVAELPGDVRVLVGVCDDLLAPRALGPLQEAVTGTGGPLERALGGGPEAVFDAAVAQLRSPRPTVLVLDDVQWADDATLDVLRYLARRLEGLPALLVLTYRPEAVVPGHPLERLLGALSGTSPATLRLARWCGCPATSTWRAARTGHSARSTGPSRCWMPPGPRPPPAPRRWVRADRCSP